MNIRALFQLFCLLPTLFLSAQDNSTKIKFLLQLPENYHKAKEPLPMLVYLHGSYAMGKNNSIKTLRGMGPSLKRVSENDMILLSPLSPRGGRWMYENQSVCVELIRRVGAKVNADPERVYLTGMSAGGHGTWEVATHFPKGFAAIAPLWSFSVSPDQAVAVLDMPV